MSNFVTALDVAIARGAKEVNGSVSAKEVIKQGIPFIGGCACCEATLGCYNAYPSTVGVWFCSECIGAKGFISTDEFERYVGGAFGKDD